MKVLSALLFLSFAAPVNAQDPVAILEDLDGTQNRVPLAELVQGDMGEAVFLRFEGVAEAPALEPAQTCALDLLSGDRLLGVVSSQGDERLGVVLPGETSLTVGLGELRSLRFPARLASQEAPLEPPSEGDRLYRVLPRGLDRVDGYLLGFNDEGVRFEGAIGERTYGWKDVAALFVEPLEAPPELPRGGTRVLVDLAGGGRITANLAGLEPGGVRLRTAGAEELLLPPSLIDEVLVANGQYAFLSWLPVDAGPPRSPFDPPGAEPLGMVWPHRLDRAVDGEALRTGGVRWARGIGVHAPSRLRFELGGEWSRLRLSAGLNDPPRGTTARGSVRYRILVDGETRWESPLMRTGGAVQGPEPIDVREASELVLEVDDGGDGPVMDRANWLRPILLKD